MSTKSRALVIFAGALAITAPLPAHAQIRPDSTDVPEPQRIYSP